VYLALCRLDLIPGVKLSVGARAVSSYHAGGFRYYVLLLSHVYPHCSRSRGNKWVIAPVLGVLHLWYCKTADRISNYNKITRFISSICSITAGVTCVDMLSEVKGILRPVLLEQGEGLRAILLTFICMP
jgi:hypothetical protein